MTFEPVEIMTENEREGGREEVEEKKEERERRANVFSNSPFSLSSNLILLSSEDISTHSPSLDRLTLVTGSI